MIHAPPGSAAGITLGTYTISNDAEGNRGIPSLGSSLHGCAEPTDSEMDGMIGTRACYHARIGVIGAISGLGGRAARSPYLQHTPDGGTANLAIRRRRHHLFRRW